MGITQICFHISQLFTGSQSSQLISDSQSSQFVTDSQSSDLEGKYFHLTLNILGQKNPAPIRIKYLSAGPIRNVDRIT